MMTKYGSQPLELIEEQMLDMVQPDCPVVHNFSDGVYVREITMPTDSIILGHKHKTRHLNIISKGSCRLVDVETGEVTLLTAPCTFESLPGVRKLLYIIDECVWSTVHVTDETDLTKIEEEVIDKSNTWIDYYKIKEIT